MKKRRFLSIALAAVLMFSTGQSVFASQDVNEPNDSPYTPTIIPAFGAANFQGYISSHEDMDWYGFHTADYGGTFAVNAIHWSPSLIVTAYKYTPSGFYVVTPIQSSQQNGHTFIEFPVDPFSSYVIYVDGAADSDPYYLYTSGILRNS
ncbi:hypothetical protein [Paenibacillus sp. YYML68]|uniref:hypothetical protein n=1 Tax=Paenibacillus sp. YYML68 TaxID=2909250 RepID=UPI002490881D|nr:hypothetical protein [Paenibacillus sp. YYML68]